MTHEARRSKRYNRFLLFGLTSLDLSNNRVITGPFPERILNISQHGAGFSCLR